MAKWNIDPDHSVGSFAIRHMNVAFVHGQMNNLSGTVEFDPDNRTDLSVIFEIIIDSIITGIAKRDEHLKSSDFFDINKYPKIIYKSNIAENTGPNSFNITGELSIHGMTRAIKMDIDLTGPVKSPFGEITIGITGRTILNREDFNIKWNHPMEKGALMVGIDVAVELNIEADLEQ